VTRQAYMSNVDERIQLFYSGRCGLIYALGNVRSAIYASRAQTCEGAKIHT
jgi:hypothetical protein